MALGAHKRDPNTNEHWFFADPGDKNEWSAQHYDTLARRHFISFQGIYEMIVAVLQDYYDVGAELEAMDEEAKRDDQLLKLKLPLHEALQIWCRSREGLLRFAELFPEQTVFSRTRSGDDCNVSATREEAAQCLGPSQTSARICKSNWRCNANTKNGCGVWPRPAPKSVRNKPMASPSRKPLSAHTLALLAYREYLLPSLPKLLPGTL